MLPKVTKSLCPAKVEVEKTEVEGQRRMNNSRYAKNPRRNRVVTELRLAAGSHEVLTVQLNQDGHITEAGAIEKGVSMPAITYATK